MKPSSPAPAYAKAIVLESTFTRELCNTLATPWSASCSKLFPSDCVFTAVMLPSLSIVNVEMKPSSPSPVYAKAYVSESTCTRELCCPRTVSCSKVSTWTILVPSDEIVNVEMKPSLSLPSYAKAYVSESTCTRELYCPWRTSCSKLAISRISFPSLANTSFTPIGTIIDNTRIAKRSTRKRSECS